MVWCLAPRVACLLLIVVAGEFNINASVLEVATKEERICDAGGKGLLFPIYEEEHQWPDVVRCSCYAIGLIYCFLGVSMIADTFMSAIEAITSRRRQVTDSDGIKKTSFYWNDTVANLSLMALGSSAPEIFLSIIDLVRKEMYASDLGPSTIVGSAAFNLLVIIAVCVMCIPYPESRKIEQMEVFCITALFSIIAYLWMAFILIIWSPDEVEWWEALVTLIFLPILIWMSYRVDIMGWAGLGFSCCVDDKCEGQSVCSNGGDSEAREKRRAFANTKYVMSMTFTSSHGGSMIFTSSADGAKQMLRRPSIANFHMQAMSNLPGQRNNKLLARTTTFCTLSRSSTWHSIRTSEQDSDSFCAPVATQNSRRKERNREHKDVEAPTVQLLVNKQVMSESSDQKVLTVCRNHGILHEIEVHYKVELLAERHYLPDEYQGAYDIRALGMPLSNLAHPSIAKRCGYASVILPVGEFDTDFIVDRPKVVDEPCNDFLVTLRGAEWHSPKGGDATRKSQAQEVRLGTIRTTQVDVSREDGPGCLGFASQAITLPGEHKGNTWPIMVVRKGGCKGTLSCVYVTESLDAVRDYDYVESSGLLIFADGVTERLIEVEILGKNKYRGEYKFLLFLKSSLNSCTFDEEDDGGEDCAILTITIGDIEEGRKMLWRKIDNLLNIGLIQMATREWKERIMSVLYCNGGAEEQEQATLSDWLFHVAALPWKILFLVVPPTAFAGGWVCFTVCLIVIGFLTGIIADFAELFGCILGIGDMITAITFVALGTSMPDLFASKVAATEDPTADASIVNVTGSNAVNVFLGLGLPWTAATIYWAVRDDLRSEWAGRYPELAEVHKTGCVFVVPSGNLGFCVIVFCFFAILCLTLLVFRRERLGCELGGPASPKAWTTFSFVFMWLGYVCLVSWRYARWDKAHVSEIIAVIGTTALVELLVAIGVVIASYVTHLDEYYEEKNDYDQTIETQVSKQFEDCHRNDQRRSSAYLAQVAANTSTHPVPQNIPEKYHSASKTDVDKSSLDNSEAVVENVGDTHSETTLFGRHLSNGIAVDPFVSMTSLEYHSEGRFDLRVNSESIRESFSASLVPVLTESVPAESKATTPHGFMSFKDGQETASIPEAPNARLEDGPTSSEASMAFGPKLMPECHV